MSAELARRPSIPKGATVSCPKCGTRIARLSRRIYAGERGDPMAFDGLSFPAVIRLANDDPRCPICDTSWWQGRIHTTKGWRP